MTVRCAIYLRISQDRRGEGLGVDRQEHECRALAEAKSWQVVAVHTDNDVSASKRNVRRAGYEQLLEDIRERRVDAVIAWAHHRLHRRLIELGTFLEDYVQPYSLKVAFVGGEIDLSTPGGRTLAKILGAVSEGEIDELRWRVQAKQRELARAGKVGNGGRRPYGYTPDRLTVVPEEAAVITEIAERVLAGDPVHAVMRDLNARQVPTVTGVSWSAVAVRRVVIKPSVAGLREYQGQIVGDAVWPAILDRGTWEAVRGILTAPGRRPAMTGRRWLLSGLTTCGPCGGSMTINFRQPRYAMYCCRNTGCGKVHRAAGRLERLVVGATVQLLQDVDRTPGTPDGAGAAELVELEARRRQVVLDAATNPRISLADRDQSLDAIDARISALQHALTVSGGRRLAAAAGPLTVEEFDALPLDRRRALIRSMVRVTVWPKRQGGAVFETETIDLQPA